MQIYNKKKKKTFFINQLKPTQQQTEREKTQTKKLSF